MLETHEGSAEGLMFPGQMLNLQCIMSKTVLLQFIFMFKFFKLYCVCVYIGAHAQVIARCLFPFKSCMC